MKKVLILLLLSFFIVKIYAQSDEIQNLWMETGLKGDFFNDWNYTAITGFRFAGGLNNNNNNYYQLRVDHKINKYVSLLASYRHQYAETDTSKLWKREVRPVLGGTFSMYISNFAFTNRTLAEYKIYEVSNNFFRFRNRVQVNYTVKRHSYSLIPFVNIEANYTSELHSLYRWRYKAGVKCKYKFVQPEIAFMYQTDNVNGNFTKTPAITAKVIFYTSWSESFNLNDDG